MSRVANLAARLPLPDQDLERRLDEVCAELSTREARKVRRRLRAANRHASLLSRMPEPPVPAAELDRRVLGSLHEDVVAESEERLRSNPSGDLIRAGFAPVAAPSDVDWAAAVLEHAAGVSPATSEALDDSVPTPGWLWARIRDDLHRYRLERQLSARRRVVVRVGVAAATIAVTALLLHAAVRRPSGDADSLDIRFIPVDRPLAAAYSTAEFARRVRDGKR